MADTKPAKKKGKPRGKPGPRRTLEQLKRAHSSEFYRRKKEESGGKRKGVYDRVIPRTPSGDEVEAYCRTAIRGYDPWRDAGELYYFDKERARAAIEWWHSHITHVKGELGGQAFELADWQMAILGNIWGWKHKETGLRRYRSMFFFVPQKNGKTLFCAALAIMFYIADGEVGSETYCLAFTVKQARLLFTMAVGIVGNDEYLQTQCRAMKYSIDKEDDLNALFQPIAVEAEGVHGTNVHTGWVDELHTITAAKEDAIMTLVDKTTSRRQPFIGKLTTAGYDRESICYRDYTYAKNVRDGVEGYDDYTLLPVIYEVDDEADWTLEETWRYANPNLDACIGIDDMQAACKKAVHSPILENKFRNLRLNQWTQQQVRWIRMEDWDRCDDGPIDLASMKGKACYGGFDYGQTRDLTALALVFPPSDPEGEFTVYVQHWIPEDNAVEHEKTDKVPYRKWRDLGLMKMTPGNVTDQAYIERDIVELAETYSIRTIGYDQWHAEQLAISLRDKHGVDMVKIPQTMAQLTSPAHLLYKLILSGRLKHGGDPCLRWQAGNVEAYEGPNEQLKLNKASDTRRIDGIIAILNALKLYETDGSKGCVYDERGIIEIDF